MFESLIHFPSELSLSHNDLNKELVYIETQLTQCVLLHLKQKTYEFDTDRGNLRQLYGRYETAALFNMGNFMGFKEQDEDGRQSFTLHGE